METQTLDDLKAKNAAEDSKAQPPEKIQEKPEDDKPEELEDKAKPEADATDEDAEKDSSDAEGWLADESKDPKADGRSIPLASHISTRDKLKGRLREKDGEIEALRKEVESLKQLKAQATVTTAPAQSMKIPSPLDFKTDAEYAEAMRNYIRQEVALTSQTQSAKSRQDAESRAREESVESHYKRADSLIQQHGISPEVYQNADLKVRQSIDMVLPGAGDAVTDALIERLGEGSEKVMYYLGRNESARATLVNKLMADKTGISASVYLGQLLAMKATAPSNSTTRAPAPAAKVKGSNKSSANAESMKKEYKQAHSSRDVQKAIDLKRKAKAAGINTSDW